MGSENPGTKPLSKGNLPKVLQKVLGLARDSGRSLSAIATELDVEVDDLIPILFSMAPVVISVPVAGCIIRYRKQHQI